MLRINRFNIGKDPVETLDNRLKELFSEFEKNAQKPKAIEKFQADSTENIKGLDEGTHKKCSSCEEIKPIMMFFDATLKSRYGRTCNGCKSGIKDKRRGYF